MAEKYKIFGSEMSPYSVKVRSYFRYKKIPHDWISRRPAVEEEYRKYAKLPIIPTVVTPADEGLQDSTPIIERLEREFPKPAINPVDPDLTFLSCLIEEFGDEWGNKLMFHHRWWDDVDQRASARTIARLLYPDGAEEDLDTIYKVVLQRMSGRGGFVGSSDATAPLITGYFLELLDILEAHLTSRRYLFGDSPAFGDFGLFAQIYEASVDPTCGGFIRARGPHVLDWCFRMIEPRSDGAFESWGTLESTMAPLLCYVGRYFLPWTTANTEALKQGREQFEVTLAGKNYTQAPQKYHAKSLQALKAKFSLVAERQNLASILRNTGCLSWLT
jgi:glutathione S-transferase